MTTQEELENLTQQLEESRDVAFQAMNYSSDLGAILLFIEESYSINSEQELVTRLLGVLNSFDLEAAICCYADADINSYSLQSDLSDDEMAYIQTTRWEHRIASEGAITAFNYDHISCLVRDMPIDDETRYGMLKDTVATLLNSVEARLKVIEKDQHILQMQQELIETTDQAMEDVVVHFSAVSSDATHVLADLMDDMKGVVMELDVDGQYEKEILQLIDSHVALVVQIHSRSEEVGGILRCYARQLRKLRWSAKWLHQTRLLRPSAMLNPAGR